MYTYSNNYLIVNIVRNVVRKYYYIFSHSSVAGLWFLMSSHAVPTVVVDILLLETSCWSESML